MVMIKWGAQFARFGKEKNYPGVYRSPTLRGTISHQTTKELRKQNRKRGFCSRRGELEGI